jgi:hypothetical protein
MKVCEQYGPSIHNVAAKYKEFAPENIVWVDDFMDAEVCIDHLIGTPDRDNLVNPLERSYSEEVKCRLALAGDDFFKMAYVMHCAIVDDDFYRQAAETAIISTGFLDGPSHCEMMDNEWLRVAWGVDTADFLLPENTHKKEYLIYTWGASQDPEEECIESIYKAVKAVGGKMLHSGLDYKFDSGRHYVFVPPAQTPQEVAERYSKCKFANAMRKEDGFELANIEAPLANCLPITLNKPCYKHFFEGTSIMVREDHLIEDLVGVFQTKVDIPSGWPKFKRGIIEKFNWRDAVTPFWDKVIEAV